MGLPVATVTFLLQQCKLNPYFSISEHSRSQMVKSLSNCVFANRMVWKAGSSHRRSDMSMICSCWHLAANITAYSVHTKVNTHKKAFTRRQTHKSHTAESVWENASVFYLCITTTSHTGPTITLQRDSGGTTHTHATLLRGLEENLGSSLTQSAGSDHAAGADGKQQHSKFKM